MARNWRYEEPVQALSLGIVEVLHEDRVVGGRVSLTNARDGTIDFAAVASVQPPPGDYVLRLASGAEHVVSIAGRAPAPRIGGAPQLGLTRRSGAG